VTLAPCASNDGAVSRVTSESWNVHGGPFSMNIGLLSPDARRTQGQRGPHGLPFTAAKSAATASSDVDWN
jgi:hypothetical protein